MLNIINSFSATVLRTVIVTVALVGCVVVISGCMSANTESDLPWNTPQSWEGSVQLPGMSGGAGY